MTTFTIPANTQVFVRGGNPDELNGYGEMWHDATTERIVDLPETFLIDRTSSGLYIFALPPNHTGYRQLAVDTKDMVHHEIINVLEF